MRSVTSYFNSTLYHKTMTRYWPLWAGWTVILFFMIPLPILNSYVSQLRHDSTAAVQLLVSDLIRLVGDLGVFVVLLSMLGMLCAMAVFGYLYNNRAVCMMHALPMRRETLFCTQYLAGLSFLIFPALAVSLLTAILELILVPSGFLADTMSTLGVWLLCYCAAALFFFSFASFCAMFTGHIIALPVFYAILNALAISIWSLFSALANRLFYGFYSLPGMELVQWLTPVYALTDAVRYSYVYAPDTSHVKSLTLAAPAVLAIYAVVGLVLAAAALAVYRRRHLETAGDVVAIPLVRPIFKAGVAFCSGLFLGTFTSFFFNFMGSAKLALSILVVLWSVIGWFAAEMLLRKSFRVFRHWKGCAVMALVMVLLCSACAFDWFGVETRVPDPEDVESISAEMSMGSPYDDGDQLLLDGCSDPETLRLLTELHRAVVEHRPTEYEIDSAQTSRITLSYQLKNGSTLSRDYHIDLFLEDLEQTGTPTYLFQQILSDRAMVAKAYDFDAISPDRLLYAQITPILPAASVPNRDSETNVQLDLSTQDLHDLWAAVLLDFEEGNIGQRWMFNDQERHDHTYRSDLIFYYTLPDKRENVSSSPAAEMNSAIYEEDATTVYSFSITLTPQSTHTLEALKMSGILDDYTLVSW